MVPRVVMSMKSELNGQEREEELELEAEGAQLLRKSQKAVGEWEVRQGIGRAGRHTYLVPNTVEASRKAGTWTVLQGLAMNLSLVISEKSR